MAGKGGFKHRKRKLDRKATQRNQKAKDSIRRVRNAFETKGQAWDPENNSSQMAKLNHAARALVARSKYSKF